MVVTSVINLDRKRSRVVFNEEISLILYLGEIRKFAIREGSELIDEQYQKLIDSVLKPRARERVLNSLFRSDKTEKQLKEILRRDGYPSEVIEDALTMAKQHHYLDDEAYGFRYLENQGKKKSKRKLMADMQKKGFKQELITELLEENPVDEASQVEAILMKKGVHSGEKLDKQQYVKLAGMLSRKGYSFEVISRVLREKEEDE